MPLELIRRLEVAVLVDDWEVAISLIEGLQFLIELWRDLYDEEASEVWQEWNVGTKLVISTNEEGQLEVAHGPQAEPYTVVPEPVLSELYKEVLSKGVPERVRGIEGLADVIGEWMHLLTDEEKLAGHLLRTHEAGNDVKVAEHESLIKLHANFHREMNHRRPEG